MSNDSYDPSRAPEPDEPIFIDCEGQRGRSKKWRTIRKLKRQRYNPNKKAARNECSD